MTEQGSNRCVLVVDGGSALGAPLVDGLRALHFSVVSVIDRTPSTRLELGSSADVVTADLDSRSTTEAAFARAVHAYDGVDAVVYVPGGLGLDSRYFVDTDDAQWDGACERVLRQGLFVLQAAHENVPQPGGRIVFVTPTVAVTGAAGIVPFASACEGLRGLAKSAARAWGDHGITVNCVAPSIDALGGDRDPNDAVPSRWPAALSAPDPHRDIAPVVALLLGPLAAAITGATIAVDGGLLMAP